MKWLLFSFLKDPALTKYINRSVERNNLILSIFNIRSRLGYFSTKYRML